MAVSRRGAHPRPLEPLPRKSRSFPEELLLAKPEPQEPFVLGFELGLALKGPAVHGLPVGGLTTRFELLL